MLTSKNKATPAPTPSPVATSAQVQKTNSNSALNSNATANTTVTSTRATKRDAPEADDDDDEVEDDVKARKRSSSNTTATSSRRGLLPSRPPTIPCTIQETNESNSNNSSSDDDLGGPSKSKKSLLDPCPDAPAGHLQDDEGSDYYPSDVEETGGVVGTTCASVERRMQRGLTTVARMAAWFAQTMPIASRNLFDSTTGRPFFVFARLRKWVDGDDANCDGDSKFDGATNCPRGVSGAVNRKNCGRWSEKGPVVVMILPCSEERPWEARVVAHYTFGTQTAAVNMPISDVHPLFLRAPTPKKSVFSSLGNNIQNHAIISSQPRKIREFLATSLTARDAKLLQDLQSKSGEDVGSTNGGVSASNATLAMAIAERLESVTLNSSGIPISDSGRGGGGSERRLTRSTNGVPSNKNNMAQHRGNGGGRDGSGENSNESSGTVTPVSGVSGAFSGGLVSVGATTSGKIKRSDPVAAHADYLYECRSTIVPVREEKSSVFMLHFNTKEDANFFNNRFVKVASDYSAYLTQSRFQTFTSPQAVKRVLLSGQTVVISGTTRLHASPFIVDPILSQKIAETGLMYIPTVSDASSQTVHHRLVCTHCHAALAVLTETNALPTLESVCAAHVGHAFAKRGVVGASGGRGKKGAVAAAPGGFVYKCVYAVKGVGGVVDESGSMVGASGSGGKKGWDLVVVN
ncbi:UNVERIFIED_CONTAM: hypothetical protein HDU68_000208 [Siphonaria sp. JEL0065]|nr:hypothetical protein HDU68_000208 [Siphonaria sp. JEL0065]